MTFDETIHDYLLSQTYQSHNTGSSFPFYTDSNNWITVKENRNSNPGIAGLWTGINWIANLVDLRKTDKAIHLTREIKEFQEKNHRIGLQSQYSWVAAYEITGNSEFKRCALNQAKELTKCYVPELNLLCRINTDSGTYVSSSTDLMNIPLLLWASERSSGAHKYLKIVNDYLERAKKLFIKDNGSTRHRLTYDRNSYSLCNVSSPKGITGGCWSRGLASTFYGFVMGGIYLERDDLIDTALRMLKYHREHTYEVIPGFDYTISTLKQPRLTDTSAGAILSAALLALKTAKDHSSGVYGRKILEKLLDKHLVATEDKGLIDGGCYDYPAGKGINESNIWGDYYTLEALYMADYGELPEHLRWLNTSRNLRAQAS